MKKKRLCFRLPRGMREKIEKVMKLFWILMCLFTFSVSANTLAQQERVSLNLKDVAVRALFDEIQRQTNLYFVFNTELTDRLGQLSVNVKNETVENVLQQILKGTGLTYKFRGDLIVIQQEDKKEDVKKGKRIVGIVIDENSGDVLPGVTVKLCSESSVALGNGDGLSGAFCIDIARGQGCIGVLFRGLRDSENEFYGEDG